MDHRALNLFRDIHLILYTGDRDPTCTIYTSDCTQSTIRIVADMHFGLFAPIRKWKFRHASKKIAKELREGGYEGLGSALTHWGARTIMWTGWFGHVYRVKMHIANPHIIDTFLPDADTYFVQHPMVCWDNKIHSWKTQEYSLADAIAGEVR